MYSVLMPVDEEPDRLDRQLETLRELPGQDELSITVLYVHEEIDSPADEAGPTVIESINENLESLQDVPDTIKRAARTLDDDGIPVTVETTTGDPIPSILDAAEAVEVDSILVAARERTPVGKAVFGSVTQGIILEGDYPVIVAK